MSVSSADSIDVVSDFYYLLLSASIQSSVLDFREIAMVKSPIGKMSVFLSLM